MSLPTFLDPWKAKLAHWLTVQGVIRAIQHVDPKAIARSLDAILDAKLGPAGSSTVQTVAIPWVQAVLKELKEPTG